MASTDIAKRASIAGAIGRALGSLLGITDTIALGVDKSELMQLLHATWVFLDPYGAPKSLTDVSPSYPSLDALRGGLDALWALHEGTVGVGVDISKVYLMLHAVFEKLEGDGAKLRVTSGVKNKSWHFEVPRRPN